VEYKKGAVIKVKDLSDDDDDENTSQYAQIQDVYVYRVHKVFISTTLQVMEFEENCRSFKVARTEETYVCLYKSLCTHGVLHLRDIDSSLFLIDWNPVNQKN